MKTHGIMLRNPLMSQLEEGQSGFLNADAIILIGDYFFVNTSHSVLEIKEKDYLVPIKRIGPGKEDFEINFNINYFFIHQTLDDEELQNLKDDKNVIGPYPIMTEIYKPSNYRNQTYPRMDLGDLIEALVGMNELIEETGGDETFIEDKKELQKFIKKKLSKLSLSALKNYEKEFLPLEGKNGEKYYIEDEEILGFITRKLEELEAQQKLSDLSTDELNKKLEIAKDNEDFELSGQIRDILSARKNNQ